MIKNEINKYLKDNNFVPSKKMGQNFLYCNSQKEKIIKAANISLENDVIEIGPGLGALTKIMISKVNSLTAIELDKRLYEYLNNNIKNPNFKLINNDILKVNLIELIKDGELRNIKIVANLPYSISSKIILTLIQIKEIDEIYILVQKEMAERICAKVKTKNYNSLTAIVSMFSETKILFTIPPSFFIPQPKVDSVLLNIKNINKYDINFKEMSTFLKVCFASKRKTLLNNLLSIYDKNLIIKNLSEINIDPGLRSETLNTDQFIEIYEKFKI